MRRRRWHVWRVDEGWLAHPAEFIDYQEHSIWTFWEDALAHAAHMAGLDRMEATA